MTRDELAADPSVLDQVEYIFTGWGAPRFDALLLASAPALSLVLMAAGSIRDAVTQPFWEARVPIVSAAAANAIPVAEFTVAQIILSMKNTHRISREMTHTTVATSRARIPGAYRRSVGLLSLGTIGRLVADRLGVFDLDVSAYDPFLDEQTAHGLGVRSVTKEQLFATSDVVSCHVPLLSETRGLVDSRLLRTLKHGATFINTARGAVVDEGALIEVFLERTDLTAVLDVTVEEPPAADSPLRQMPNVFLTAHSAGSQGQECWRLGELVLADFERHLAGLALQHVVTESTARTRS